jgi:transcriptional regulator with XRE-family HTH domain
MSQLRDVAQPFGPRLKVARENASMSRKDLARRLGVEESSVAAWENDSRAPRANRLIMLAGILGVSIGWLLEGREDSYMATADEPSDMSVAHNLRTEIEQVRSMLSDAQAALHGIAERLGSLSDSGSGS